MALCPEKPTSGAPQRPRTTPSPSVAFMLVLSPRGRAYAPRSPPRTSREPEIKRAALWRTGPPGANARGRHDEPCPRLIASLAAPRRAKPRPDAYIHEAPAALATGAPISTANPKVRVSVIWLLR